MDIHCSYTRMGGDSLSIVRILSLLRQQGKHISPSRLIEASSIAQIANVLEEVDQAGQSSDQWSEEDAAKVELSAEEKAWIKWRYDLKQAQLEDMYLGTY